MIDITEINEYIKTYEALSKKYNLNLNIIMLWKELYQSHKERYGSFKIYISKPEYPIKMQERYDFILNCIDEKVSTAIREVRQ